MHKHPSYAKCMLCGILWGVATFIVLLVVLLALLPPRAKADDGRNCTAVSRLIVMPHGVSVDAGDGGAIFILKRDVRFDEAGPLRVCWGAAQRPVLYMPSDAWPQFAGRVHLAHGGFDWIRRHHGEAKTAQSGGWQDGDFGGCCGKQDCFPVKAEYQMRDIDGKKVPGFFIPEDNEFVPEGKPHSDVSRDPEGRAWRCYRMLGSQKMEPRQGCFFYNPGGG